MVAHAFNPRTQEAEAGWSLNSRPPGIQIELQDSQDNTEKPCLSRKIKTKTKQQKLGFSTMQRFRDLLAILELSRGLTPVLVKWDQLYLTKIVDCNWDHADRVQLDDA